MSAQIPEWFKETVIFLVNQHKIHFKNEPTNLEIINYAWQVINQPKNQAKLKETKALIEAAKPCFSDLQKVLSCTDDEICKACKLEEALKPFKGGEL